MSQRIKQTGIIAANVGQLVLIVVKKQQKLIQIFWIPTRLHATNAIKKWQGNAVDARFTITNDKSGPAGR